MNQKHQRTLQAVFEDPGRSSVPWRGIRALLEAAGAEITEGEGSRVRVALNGVRAVFHRPHPKKEGSRGGNGLLIAVRERELSTIFKLGSPQAKIFRRSGTITANPASSCNAAAPGKRTDTMRFGQNSYCRAAKLSRYWN